MRKQAEHRIRAAADLARPGRAWLAAILMNTPWVAGSAIAGWIAFSADEPAVQAMAGILFAVVFLWTLLVTLESWRVLRRFARRRSSSPTLAAPPQ